MAVISGHFPLLSILVVVLLPGGGGGGSESAFFQLVVGSFAFQAHASFLALPFIGLTYSLIHSLLRVLSNHPLSHLQQQQDKDHELNVLLLGCSGVGKTSLVQSFYQGHPETLVQGIPATTLVFSTNRDDMKIQFNVWEIDISPSPHEEQDDKDKVAFLWAVRNFNPNCMLFMYDASMTNATHMSMSGKMELWVDR